MARTNKNMVYTLVSLFSLILICVYPNIAYAIIREANITYIITSVMFTLPVIMLGMLMPRRWIYVVFVLILTIFSIVDLTMIDLYDDYLLAGGIISTIKTNPQEASEFYRTNWVEIFRWIPLILLACLSCITYRKIHRTSIKVLAGAAMMITPVLFITAKLVVSYKSEITLRYYMDNRVWNRTPYNVVYQSINANKVCKNAR